MRFPLGDYSAIRVLDVQYNSNRIPWRVGQWWYIAIYIPYYTAVDCRRINFVRVHQTCFNASQVDDGRDVRLTESLVVGQKRRAGRGVRLIRDDCGGGVSKLVEMGAARPSGRSDGRVADTDRRCRDFVVINRRFRNYTYILF